MTSIICFSTADGKYFFSPEDIIRLEASSNYTKVFFSNKTKIVTAKVLKDRKWIIIDKTGKKIADAE